MYFIGGKKCRTNFSSPPKQILSLYIVIAKKFYKNILIKHELSFFIFKKWYSIPVLQCGQIIWKLKLKNWNCNYFYHYLPLGKHTLTKRNVITLLLLFPKMFIKTYEEKKTYEKFWNLIKKNSFFKSRKPRMIGLKNFSFLIFGTIWETRVFNYLTVQVYVQLQFCTCCCHLSSNVSIRKQEYQ